MSMQGFTLFNARNDDLKAAKAEWSERLLKAPRATGYRSFSAPSVDPDQNVVGVGIGEQLTDGKGTGTMALKFLVRKKYPEGQLSKKSILPKSVGGLPVDVEETGLFRSFRKSATASAKGMAAAMPNPKTRIRPAQPGCSIGYRDPNDQYKMAGTFGALVKDAEGQYILSNNHVLADENRLRPGDPIFQPGLLDGGDPKRDQVAVLTRFIKLQVMAPNKVDCAVAKVSDSKLVSKDILFIGPPAGLVLAVIDMPVHKFGRTTSYSVGRVTSVDTDVTVGYETGNYMFQEQIIVVGRSGHAFSAAGDSGSLILERHSNKAVGLLFAGSASHTIANHIQDVLQALRVTLA